jgi:hypothetical protein
MRPVIECVSARRYAVRVRPRAMGSGPLPRGQSTLEYLIVLMLVGISLTAGPRSALEQVFRTFGEHYVRLTDALSRP